MNTKYRVGQTYLINTGKYVSQYAELLSVEDMGKEFTFKLLRASLNFKAGEVLRVKKSDINGGAITSINAHEDWAATERAKISAKYGR